MVFDPIKPYRCNQITLDFATENWEQRQYWDLRKQVFVKEQGIFEDTDRDVIDGNAIPIVAKCECMGMSDQVVGVVRIDERSPGIWYGSRLAVEKNYRTLSRFNTKKLFEADNIHPFTLSVGAALIFKAVTTANYYDCDRFLAHVQKQNVKFFERMHWKVLDKIEIMGREHALMEADLNFYPASVYAAEIHTSIAL